MNGIVISIQGMCNLNFCIYTIDVGDNGRLRCLHVKVTPPFHV